MQEGKVWQRKRTSLRTFFEDDQDDTLPEDDDDDTLPGDELGDEGEDTEGNALLKMLEDLERGLS